jgi:hypothetical protein
LFTKGVLTPINYSKLNPTQRNLFLYSERKVSYGIFDKLKARLVGGGDNQDKKLLVIDPSSPING